jgi:hypothetical protein
MTQEKRSVIDLVREAADIDGRVERNPYLMVAGALGAGFILGGGLFTRLTERIAGAALRIGMMAALPQLQDEIGRYVGRNTEASSSTKEEGGSS